MSGPLTTRAPAKINLTLHVLGRRADGYHELESLVAFASVGDSLSLSPSPSLGLTVDGPAAPMAGSDANNLVMKAARSLSDLHAGLRVGVFHLTKRLPVAAGIGGGSSDAAGALRLLARLNGMSLADPLIREAARLTGADVPVCLEPRARMMRGIGENVSAALRLPPLFAVLVNPRVPVETPTVFKALGLQPGQALPGLTHPDIRVNCDRSIVAQLKQARNDLEPPARSVQPLITEALALLAGTDGCRLARMSGSGATVFGLYDDRAKADEAAKAMNCAKPDWWTTATVLR